MISAEAKTGHALARGLALCGLLLAVSPLSADILKYKCRDGFHFTDQRLSGCKYLGRIKSQGSSAGYSAARFIKNKSKVSPLINATAKRVKLHPGLLHAVVMVESAYNPRARSKKGAEGLMQLMPGTASRYGVNDVYDPKQNLEGGARYLKDLLKEFEFDLQLALAAYNAGENAVRRYGNQIPPYPETEAYVEKVMGLYRENMQAMLSENSSS